MPCNLEKKEEEKEKIFALSRNMWIGTEVTIEADGTVFINGKRQVYARRVVVQRKEKYTRIIKNN